jgi:hypothetical protein
MTTWELPTGSGRIKPDVMAFSKDVMGSRMNSGCRSLSGEQRGARSTYANHCTRLIIIQSPVVRLIILVRYHERWPQLRLTGTVTNCVGVLISVLLTGSAPDAVGLCGKHVFPNLCATHVQSFQANTLVKMYHCPLRMLQVVVDCQAHLL